MTDQERREVLVYAEISGEYRLVMRIGMRDFKMRINNRPVDVTTRDSSGHRQLLAGAGVQSVSVIGSGELVDSVAKNAMLNTEGSEYKMKFDFPGRQVLHGTFLRTQVDLARGPSFTWESSGEFYFTEE